MSTLKEICKEQTEMIDEMRQNIKELTEENEKLSEQYNKMLEERNSLIDDLSWCKAKFSMLEDENEEIKESHIKHITNMENYYKDRVQELKEENKDKNRIISKRLEHENEKLRKANSSGWKQKDEIANKLISDIKCKNNLLSEFSQHIGNKPSSSTYKYFREKLNALEIREGD